MSLESDINHKNIIMKFKINIIIIRSSMNLNPNP